MKKGFICIMCVLLAMGTLFSCGEDKTNDDEKNLAPKNDLLNYARYSDEVYLKPFWYTREVYNETIMFVGEDDAAPLLYEPDEIISVLDYGLNIEYVKDVDWVYEDGLLKRTKNSSIPYWDIDEYYRTTPDKHSIGVDKTKISIELDGNRYLKYGEADTFTSKQIAVTYTHSKSWQGAVPVDKSDRLVKIANKLSSGESPTILFYGDSITTGCNSSGTDKGGNVSPYAPSFPEMICSFLEKKYSVDVNYINTAVGGWKASQGQASLDERVIAYAPDLVFIGFGMNDGKTNIDSYVASMRDMTERIHNALPNTEIVLIATMLPNYEADNSWYRNQPFQAAKLLEFESEYSYVTVVNMTEMHQSIFDAGKRYRDVTGNNINHPNDFVCRLYAQTILKTILGTEFVNDKLE